ncbi:DUR4 [Candida pseudojiufengensis]|uniref:DUR4 n=1 Tax=Candida pseudojiufengensis TaxID=497109 RepID=UPI002224B45E|nr:DUR4 [Candida pseudojiufengensis]KAI5960628.1 DUR4 [Candida pseudojiufengensis]
MEPSLSNATGYCVIILGSLFFIILMNSITYIQNKYSGHNSRKVEEFVNASRNVNFGLMLSGIVSNWTWSLTLLMSAVKGYQLGASGGYMYAIGGAIQVSIFSFLASLIKARCQSLTTFVELGYFRFGVAGHLSFLWVGFVCNAIVSACILLGGSAVFNSITGINVYACLYLIPFGCACYISFGGLRATFISDATHTCIILVFIITFVIKVYFSNEFVGTPQKMWDALQSLPPVDGNYKGSYLTFNSQDTAVFSVISLITGFGLTICDQSYFARAVASDKKHTSKSYFFAALCWFCIPFAMGMIGVAARALSIFPGFPSLSAEEVNEGLPAVAAIEFVMGKGGAAMMLVMIFFSVTSSFSGELIATSTLISFDMYKRYYNPKATPQEVVKVAKVGVFVWAIFSSSLASIFYGPAKISMGWLFNFLGVGTASGCFPIVLSITYKNLNKAGAVGGSVGGMILGLIAWLCMCKGYLGEINVVNLSDQWVSFTGNVTSLVMGGVISLTCSWIWPANFDFESIRNRTTLYDNKNTVEIEPEQQLEQQSEKSAEDVKTEKDNTKIEVEPETDTSTSDLESKSSFEIEQKYLNRQYKKYCGLVLLMAFVLAIVIPVPLCSSPYVFSPKFLLGFMIIILLWLFFSFSFVIVLPVIEARRGIWRIFKKLVLHKS